MEVPLGAHSSYVRGQKGLKKPQSEIVNRRTDNKYNDQQKKVKKTNNDLKILHIKLKNEQHEPHYKPGVNLGVPEG